MPTEIAFPFHIDANGRVATTDDPVRLAGQHLIAALGTRPGERVMDPEYGSPAQEYVFDNDVRNELTAALNEGALRLVPEVEIMTVEINEDVMGVVDARITFLLRDTAEQGEVVLPLRRIAVREAGVVTEEIE